MESSFYVGEPPAPSPPLPSKNDQLDAVLTTIQQTTGSLGGFLYDVFHYVPRHQNPRNSDKQRGVVSTFLGGRLAIKAEQIVEMMHDHRTVNPSNRVRGLGTQETHDPWRSGQFRNGLHN